MHSIIVESSIQEFCAITYVMPGGLLGAVTINRESSDSLCR